MDDGDSSTASSVDFYDIDRPKAVTPSADASWKRRADTPPGPNVKRQKLSLALEEPSHSRINWSDLPDATWQMILSFCSPADLGRLMQVNRRLHTILDVNQNEYAGKSEHQRVRSIRPDSIWAGARNALAVKPPKPLPDLSEQEMWQLAWSRTCQFCNKRASTVRKAGQPWEQGPGDVDVRVIWPFRIRSCGPCLLEKSQTDASLLFSSVSAARAALPFALITADRNYIPAYSLQAAVLPANVTVSKYYLKEDVKEIAQELENILAHGPAAGEEWIKGLEARGAQRMKAAENWERWEQKYGDQTEQKRNIAIAPTTLPLHNGGLPNAALPVGSSSASAVPHLHTRLHDTMPQSPQRSFAGLALQSSRTERGLQGANEAKALRRSDIEQRCQLLDPPIVPNVLRHMESFKAAIQISQPMTEDAWILLKPRLLAQRADAERAELAAATKRKATPGVVERGLSEANTRDAKEALDREWDESQRLIRAELGAIADDFISRHLDTGVGPESAPQFAADLLLHTVHTFRISKHHPKESVKIPAAGNGLADPEAPCLVLDSVKWVFDNKVKPLTEVHRRELFLCNGEGCESHLRFYGFESVIQHFAAKHTGEFSSGNVVVAWREAEWPEAPPFHPSPGSIQSTIPAESSASGIPGLTGTPRVHSRVGNATPRSRVRFPQPSPASYQYGGHPDGPFPPPPIAVPGATGLPGLPYSGPVQGYLPQSSGVSAYGPPPMAGAVASPYVGPTSAAQSYSGFVHPTSNSATKQGVDGGRHDMVSSEREVSSIVGLFQDLWPQIAGIPDIPHSLRIYVLMHRIVSRFHLAFNHEPSLDDVLDAMTNHDLAEKLNMVVGLTCKACQSNDTHTGVVREERQTFDPLNLLLHFRASHAEVFQSGATVGKRWSWKEDLIEIPGDRYIAGLIHAGLDYDQLQLLASVFPQLFPTPLPQMLPADQRVPHAVSSPPGSGSAKRPTLAETAARQHSHASSHRSTRAESRIVEAADEYDPQRSSMPSIVRRSPRIMSQQLLPDERVYYVADNRDENGRPLAMYPRHAQSSGGARFRDYEPPSEIVYVHTPGSRAQPSMRFLSEEDDAWLPTREPALPDHDNMAPVYEQYGRPVPRRMRYAEESLPQAQEQSPMPGYAPEHGNSRPRTSAERFLDEFAVGRSSEASQPPPQDTNAPDAQPKLPGNTIAQPNGQSPEGVVPDAGDCEVAAPAPRRVINSAGIPLGLQADSIRGEVRVQHHAPVNASGQDARRYSASRGRDRPTERGSSRFERYRLFAREDPYVYDTVHRAAPRRFGRYAAEQRRFYAEEASHSQPPLSRSRDHSVDYGSGAHEVEGPRPEQVYSAPRRGPSSLARYRRYEQFVEAPRAPSPVLVDRYGHRLEAAYNEMRPQTQTAYFHDSRPPVRRYVEYDDRPVSGYASIAYARPPPRVEYVEYDYPGETERQQSVRWRNPTLSANGDATHPDEAYEGSSTGHVKLEEASNGNDAM